MANVSMGAKTVCPFYLHEAKFSITCEGLIGAAILSRFGSVEEKLAHQEAVCCGFGYTKLCPLAAALMKKYEEDEL